MLELHTLTTTESMARAGLALLAMVASGPFLYALKPFPHTSYSTRLYCLFALAKAFVLRRILWPRTSYEAPCAKACGAKFMSANEAIKLVEARFTSKSAAWSIRRALLTLLVHAWWLYRGAKRS